MKLIFFKDIQIHNETNIYIYICINKPKKCTSAVIYTIEIKKNKEKRFVHKNKQQTTIRENEYILLRFEKALHTFLNFFLLFKCFLFDMKLYINCAINGNVDGH